MYEPEVVTGAAWPVPPEHRVAPIPAQKVEGVMAGDSDAFWFTYWIAA